MSWWEYVVKTSGTESPKAMSAKTQIDGPNFSKWKTGHVPKVDLVARFARAYDRPVLEAFVEAEFLTPAEAKQSPAAAPDFSQLTNDELLKLVRARMGEGGERGGDTPATKDAGSGRLTLVDDEAARDVGRRGSVAQVRDSQDRAGEPPADDPDDMEPR